ncbi:beta-ketoacyl-[acyl-carrier-protein] synthase family protein [Kitasatospora sp. RG8]|uniref:beta-ketoacyl synthase N-terminal-like domain-containing protein n=1 Tax=Kitasatospora sp. RG8 TaxID=2820815 RepID=UPI001ADFA9FB|nr:beta-ketoacyl synthase N-terminal-like domain-containing protein [Kitasatospora sp. RG8]MBP0455078.1 beta-ketoacyl-[acyl-carrier-protein] synthase family protein [Kitasatospora sp. RG8]
MADGDVVVTGLGAVSGLGGSVGALWAGLLAADRRPDQAPGDYGPGERPPVYLLDPSAAGRERASDRSPGRAGQAAVDAVGQALADAGLRPGELTELGLTVGTTLGDIDLVENAEPGAAPPGGAYRVSAAVAARHRLWGPNQTLSTACSAGLYAVIRAWELIGSGAAEVVVACGTDSYSRVALAALDRFGLVDPELCRPFDAARQGMVTGEGAAAVVLESAAHARRRGAPVHAVLGRAGVSCDGHHPTAPEPGGAQLGRAIAAALDGAGGPVGAVVPHRAGIAVNDAVETAAIARALGAAAATTPVFGIKAVLGHTAGAAGLFACVAAVLMLRHRTVPPNAHVSVPDPDCPLQLPVGAVLPLVHPRVLVSATGFGGNNAALVLEAAR